MVVSGAGISLSIPRAGSSECLPTWPTLLQRLHAEFEGDLPNSENVEMVSILATKDIPAETLIEMAGRLRRIDVDRFDDVLRKQVTPEPGSFSETHRAIGKIQPRGILTFNYDDCHENSLESLGVDVDVLIPEDEDRFVEHLRDGLRNRFLLKAHGCIHRRNTQLVLDSVSYRELFSKRPAYRAFVQNLLTQFDCLFVGFGLSDPDFDLFVNVIAASYGSPIRNHVAIRHQNEKNSSEYFLKSKHGIHVLHVSDWPIIPDIVMAGAETAGPTLQRILESALSPQMEKRSVSHRELTALGTMGKQVASKSLLRRLRTERDEFRISEIAYALGVTDPMGNKDTLISIVSNTDYGSAAPAARALTVLKSALTPDDLRQLASWSDRFRTAIYPDDPKNRLLKYCEYYETYIPAKFASDPS